jgi:hypothetical protein
MLRPIVKGGLNNVFHLNVQSAGGHRMKNAKVQAPAMLARSDEGQVRRSRTSLKYEISRIERRLKSIYSVLGEITYGLILAGMAATTMDPRINELLIRTQFFLTELEKLRSQLSRAIS